MTRAEFRAAYSPKPSKPEPHTFGLFVWRGDGRYAKADAITIYQYKKIAQLAADRRNASGDYNGMIVVRRVD